MTISTNSSNSYRSTRDADMQPQRLSFEEAVLMGLAPDGGLYVPTSMPLFTLDQIHSWADLPFYALSFHIIRPFVPVSIQEGGIPDDDLMSLLERSFATFSHPEVTPVVSLSDKVPHAAPGNMHVLELFHGPTFAFKDVALQASSLKKRLSS